MSATNSAAERGQPDQLMRTTSTALDPSEGDLLPEKSTGVRRERKFIAKSHCDAKDVLYMLQCFTSGLKSEYDDRWINNVYYDTTEAYSALENLAGVPNRKKYRMRWYGDFFQRNCEARFECKTRQAINGAKFRSPVPPFDVDQNTDLRSLVAQRGSVARELEFVFLVPTLVNRYHRSYYKSLDDKLRVTIDSRLQFWRPLGAFQIGSQRPMKSENVVVEVKYAREDEALARAFIGKAPLRLSKNSKYVTGLLLW